MQPQLFCQCLQKVRVLKYTVQVPVWTVEEKLPEGQSMILADTGSEWHILMYASDNFGVEWEDDTKVYFIRWAYLSSLQAGDESTGEVVCRHCKTDVLVHDHPVDDILPLGRRGCEKCACLSYYCDECNEKILRAVYQSE